MTVDHSAGMQYMTVDELKARSKPRKFRNEPTTVDGLRFDSRKEARRWRNLNIGVAIGEISELRRQVSYDLHVLGGMKLWAYVADFVYVRDGSTIVEDVKSPATRKHPVYVAKKKHMQLEYGIEVTEW